MKAKIQIKNYPQRETPMMTQYGNSIRRASNYTTPLYVLYAMYVQLAGLSRIGQTGNTAKSRRLTYAGHRWGGGFYLLPDQKGGVVLRKNQRSLITRTGVCASGVDII